MRGLVIATALAGCSFNPGQLQNGGGDDAGGSNDGGGSGSGSGSDDAGIDSNGATCMNFTPQANPAHLSPCAAAPGPAYTLANDAVYDTTTGTMVSLSPAPPSTVINGMRVISVDAFTLNARMRVGGTMPLVIVSWSTITINATLDLASERTGVAQVIGAGARDTNATNGADNEDCGGGGGGGFGSVGGNGGTGSNGVDAGGTGGALTTPPPITVVGGRAGSFGGASGTSRGAGGAGGGAVQLTARQAIIVNSAGRIHAGGAGGQGGVGDGGGGGGGSGGYIGLDAPTVTLNSAAILAANGGGGGTGCDGGDGPEGQNGPLSAGQAAGGAQNTCVTPRAGGAGANGTTAAGFGADSPESGGGGGGGVGFILVWTQTLTNMAVVSPALMQP